MNNCILILFLLLLSACSGSGSSRIEVADKTPDSNKTFDENLINGNIRIETQTAKNESSKNFDCSDPNSYEIEKDRNDEFNLVNIIQGNKVVETLKLPTGLSQNGFALNWAKKTKSGFEISIEYGSRFYYQKDFGFVCKNRQFYLGTIKTTSFDKHDPENSGEERKIAVKSNVLLSNFKVEDYMTD